MNGDPELDGLDLVAEFVGRARRAQAAAIDAGALPVPAPGPAAAPRLTMKSDSWGTPAAYVDAAARALGRIDLDPASSAAGNRRVMARTFYDAAADGLTADWERASTVFVNPPGGLVRPFWRRLLDWRGRDPVCRAAVWIGYSLEQLQTLQTDGPGPVAVAAVICYPRKRIAFLDADGVPARAPTHANFVALLGAGAVVDRFRAAFGPLGDLR